MAKHNYKMGDFVKLVAIGNGANHELSPCSGKVIKKSSKYGDIEVILTTFPKNTSSYIKKGQTVSFSLGEKYWKVEAGQSELKSRIEELKNA